MDRPTETTDFEAKLVAALRGAPAEWTPDCIEEEKLLDFVEQGDKHPDAQRLTRHIASCLYCTQGYLAMQEAQQLAEETQPQPAAVAAVVAQPDEPAIRIVGRQGRTLRELRWAALTTATVSIAACLFLYVALQSRFDADQRRLRAQIAREFEEKSAQKEQQIVREQEARYNDLKTTSQQQTAASNAEIARLRRQVQEKPKAGDGTLTASVSQAVVARAVEVAREAQPELDKSLGNTAGPGTLQLEWKPRHPKQETVFSNTITFAWEAIPGAESYMVVVQRAEDSQEFRSQPTRNPQASLILPAFGEASKPQYYLWYIEVRRKSVSKPDTSSAVKFAVFDAQRFAVTLKSDPRLR